MSGDERLEVVHFNIRSINARLYEFKVFLYVRKPHIVCLQETRANFAHLPTFINYQTKWVNRPNNAVGGGIALLIRSDIIVIPTELNVCQNAKLEVQRCKIRLQNLTWTYLIIMVQIM